MNTATACISGDSCPSCQATLTVTDTLAAATWECSACGWTVTLPAVAGGSR
jgi:ribosomal protein L37AE/L43A